MSLPALVSLIDVDNTLLDHDRVVADVRRFLVREVGAPRADRYWAIFEELRGELGYADYLGALQRYRLENPHESHVLAVSSYLVNYPFANRLFPESLDVVEHLRRFGPTVVCSDGDVVFQPWKIERAGLMDAVERNVLVYVHKEQELHDVERRYPAAHYAMVDDKPRLLAAVKRHWDARVTTVFVRQGHYASDPVQLAAGAPDVALGRIGELLEWSCDALVAAARGAP